MKNLIFYIACIIAATPSFALTKDEAYKYGQLLHIWSFCQNEFTATAKALQNKAEDSPDQFPDDYKNGFLSISKIEGYSHTEKLGLGTFEKNQARRHFCNFNIRKKFPEWILFYKHKE